MASEDRLRNFDPFSKFMCIKAIIFFSYWQTCLFNGLIYFGFITDIISANENQNIIISMEIVLAAVAQSLAFSYKVFLIDNETNRNSLLKAIDDVFTVKDVVEDAQNVFLFTDSNPLTAKKYYKTELHEIFKKE